MDKPFHCIILSTKSAGSSALQKLLVEDYGFRMSLKTPHHENETLFWTKAASILGLVQLKMHRSRVPYSGEKALESLDRFLSSNLKNYRKPHLPTKEMLFDFYYSLIKQHQPRFVEKSPHHLYNKSNLDLMEEFICRFNLAVDFKVIGLVRHPLSVIYSGWERWRYDCRQFEKEWLISNSNLLDYRERLGIDLVRYEDLVADNGGQMHSTLGLEPASGRFLFRSCSLHKWKTDNRFGHMLGSETIQLAQELGYSDFDTSTEKFSWSLKSWSAYAGAEMKRFLR